MAKEPNWRKKLRKMGVKLEAGTLASMLIYHDDWCREMHGKGMCNCDPNIKITKGPPSVVEKAVIETDRIVRESGGHTTIHVEPGDV